MPDSAGGTIVLPLRCLAVCFAGLRYHPHGAVGIGFRFEEGIGKRNCRNLVQIRVVGDCRVDKESNGHIG